MNDMDVRMVSLLRPGGLQAMCRRSTGLAQDFAVWILLLAGHSFRVCRHVAVTVTLPAQSRRTWRGPAA
jgi:hypothetical protein